MNIPSRRKAIDEAPPERKAELEKIERHLLLVDESGGEENLKAIKKSTLARIRGLGGLFQPSEVQRALYYTYVGEVVKENVENKGPTEKEREAKERAAWEKYDSIALRGRQVASLVFHVAASPKALELAGKGESMRAHYLDDIGNPKRKFSETQRADCDRMVDDFVEQIKKLPKLPDEQLQKQFEAFDETTIPFGK